MADGCVAMRMRRNEKIGLALSIAGMMLTVVLCSVMLSSCGSASIPAETLTQRSHTYEKAGDSALPSLEDGYAYILAEVTEKNPETDSLEIEVLPWGLDGPFAKGALAAGSAGTVSCSELVLYPAGIQYGTQVVIACKTVDADAFPLTAYSIEKLDWFEERIARAASD